MRRLTKFILIISLTLLFISACTESNQQTRKDRGSIIREERRMEELLLNLTGKFSIGERYSSNGSTIEVIETKARARIEYSIYKKLVNDTNKNAKLRMWTQNKINSEFQLLPKGGLIKIEVFSNTINSANTKWWEYIVLSLNGKVIMRKRGSDTLPNDTKSREVSFEGRLIGNVWWDTDVLPLTNDVGQQFKVFVIDIIGSKRSDQVKDKTALSV